MPEQDLKSAARWIARAAVAACIAATLATIAAGVALALVLSVRANDAAARTEARQARALLMFETCAKGDDAIDPVKLHDFHQACAGYSTLAEAYETQGVAPPG